MIITKWIKALEHLINSDSKESYANGVLLDTDGTKHYCDGSVYAVLRESFSVDESLLDYKPLGDPIDKPILVESRITYMDIPKDNPQREFSNTAVLSFDNDKHIYAEIGKDQPRSRFKIIDTHFPKITPDILKGNPGIMVTFSVKTLLRLLKAFDELKIPNIRLKVSSKKSTNTFGPAGWNAGNVLKGAIGQIDDPDNQEMFYFVKLENKDKSLFKKFGNRNEIDSFCKKYPEYEIKSIISGQQLQKNADGNFIFDIV